jgi:hypothetical protein
MIQRIRRRLRYGNGAKDRFTDRECTYHSGISWLHGVISNGMREYRLETANAWIRLGTRRCFRASILEKPLGRVVQIEHGILHITDRHGGISHEIVDSFLDEKM